MWGAIRDLESSRLSEAEKALFRFVHKLNRDNANVSQQDVDTLLAAGWSEEAVYDAVSVCALFNFYNRWIDATGVHALSEEAHRQGGKRTAAHGYARD